MNCHLSALRETITYEYTTLHPHPTMQQPNKENVKTTTPKTQKRHSYRTPEFKRSLGRIALFPSAYQCGWLGRGHLKYATIAADSTTLNTDEGDTFEGVGTWVQAEQRRELMRIQMEDLMSQMDCPDTPALFRQHQPNNFLSTVNENEPLTSELTDLMNSVDSLAIEINEEDRDIYDDDEIDDLGFDLDGNDGAGGIEEQEEQESDFHASMGRRWRRIEVEEQEEEQEDFEDIEDMDDGISPRSVTNMNGGGRIMNFDMLEKADVEEIDTESATAIACREFIKEKGKELLQRSLSNTGTIPSTVSAEAAPMVIAGDVSIKPLEVFYNDNENENDQGLDNSDEDNCDDDAVACALAIFKKILNQNSELNSPQKREQQRVDTTISNLLSSSRTSPIFVRS